MFPSSSCSGGTIVFGHVAVRNIGQRGYKIRPPIILPPRYHGTKNIQHKKVLYPDPHYGGNYHNPYMAGLRKRSSLPYHGRFHYYSRRDVRHFRHSPKVSNSESYSVLQAKSLQHWFKDWQELRKQKLTASTFGGAIGLWRGRRVQLWLEKLGVIDPFPGSFATLWNNIKEEDAVEQYRLITGNSIVFPDFQVYNKNNPDDDWLAASPDGVIYCFNCGFPSVGVLEIKCPFFAGEKEKASPWSRIPLHYMPQAQGLMEILDKDWMDLYCWTLNGSSLFRVHRDRQYWELLETALSDFWWKHVHPAMEIYRTTTVKDPITELKSLKPAPKHNLCRDIVYASKHLVDGSELLWREIHGKF